MHCCKETPIGSLHAEKCLEQFCSMYLRWYSPRCSDAFNHKRHKTWREGVARGNPHEWSMTTNNVFLYDTFLYKFQYKALLPGFQCYWCDTQNYPAIRASPSDMAPPVSPPCIYKVTISPGAGTKVAAVVTPSSLVWRLHLQCGPFEQGSWPHQISTTYKDLSVSSCVQIPPFPDKPVNHCSWNGL